MKVQLCVCNKATPLRLTFFVFKHAHLFMRFIVISNSAGRGYFIRILVQALCLSWYPLRSGQRLIIQSTLFAYTCVLAGLVKRALKSLGSQSLTAPFVCAATKLPGFPAVWQGKTHTLVVSGFLKQLFAVFWLLYSVHCFTFNLLILISGKYANIP